MDHHYTQVGAEHHGSPNFSLLDEPHLLTGVEEASLTDRIGSLNNASVNTGQFSIPRKPVEENTARVSEIPAKSTQVEKVKQSTQSNEVPRQAHIFKNW